METNPKDQNAKATADHKMLKEDPKAKPEELEDFQIPDRNYHHDNLQDPDTENIDELGHDQLDDDWRQHIDDDNGDQNGQNQDLLSEEQEDED